MRLTTKMMYVCIFSPFVAMAELERMIVINKRFFLFSFDHHPNSVRGEPAVSSR